MLDCPHRTIQGNLSFLQISIHSFPPMRKEILFSFCLFCAACTADKTQKDSTTSKEDSLLSHYELRMTSLGKQIDFFTHRLPPYAMLNEKSPLIMAKVKKLTTERNNMVYRLLHDHLPKGKNADILLKDNYALTPLQVEELLRITPDSLKKKDELRRLLQFAKAENHTAPGKPFIPFTLSTLEGREIVLQDVVHTHRMTFIDFWASWCVPCCQELPQLQKLYTHYKPQGLTIIGISLDTDHAHWRNAVYKYALTFPQASDLKGMDSPVAKAYFTQSIPRNFLFNSRGTIIGKNLSMEELEEMLRRELRIPY